MSPLKSPTQNVQGDLYLQPPLWNLDDLQKNLTLYQFQLKKLKIHQSLHTCIYSAVFDSSLYNYFSSSLSIQNI